MSVHARLAIGLMVMLFFTLVLLVVIPTYVEEPMFIPGFAPGPDMWPRTIAVVGMGVGLVFVVFHAAEWRSRGRYNRDWLMAAITKTKQYWIRGFVGIAALLIYVECVPVLGIVPASSLLLAALYIMMGKKSPMMWMIGLAVGFPFALYWLFTSITTTLFPMGTLWESLGF